MFGEIAAALWAELLKVRRSRVPWVTFAAFTVAGLVGGFFMFVLQDPDRARSLGLLGAKAQFAGGTADWAGYFAFTAQIAAVAAMFVCVFAAQVIAALGFGAWFPFSVPSLLSGVAGPEHAGPGALSIAGVGVVGAVASLATVIWWEYADHDR